MNEEKILSFNASKIISIVQFVLLVCVATIAPIFGQQIITGTLVNAALFASVMLLGVRAGILVGLIPSVIALSVGTLPAALFPMIPFIIAGNVILVAVFNYLKGKNYWLKITLASLLKFIFIFGSSLIVANLFIKKELAATVITMMSWPQLLTALSGGALAYLILSFRKA